MIIINITVKYNKYLIKYNNNLIKKTLMNYNNK